MFFVGYSSGIIWYGETISWELIILEIVNRMANKKIEFFIKFKDMKFAI